MTRAEARGRIGAAVRTLADAGWTRAQIEAAINGLHRDDAVEHIEVLAERAAVPEACQ